MTKQQRKAEDWEPCVQVTQLKGVTAVLGDSGSAENGQGEARKVEASMCGSGWWVKPVTVARPGDRI